MPVEFADDSNHNEVVSLLQKRSFIQSHRLLSPLSFGFDKSFNPSTIYCKSPTPILGSVITTDSMNKERVWKGFFLIYTAEENYDFHSFERFKCSVHRYLPRHPFKPSPFRNSLTIFFSRPIFFRLMQSAESLRRCLHNHRH